MKIEIRADSVEIEGYVNAVGRDSRRITNEYGEQFVEQVQPGAFAKALNAASEPIAILLDHDAKRKLGDTSDNLILEEDSIGLHAKATVTDPEVIELARNKKLRGWSFGFFALDEKVSYDYDNHVERHVITELDLVEVSIIDDTMRPVYAGTSISARADEERHMLCRALDSDEIRYILSETRANAEETKTETKKETKEVVDYSKYHDAINTLRR